MPTTVDDISGLARSLLDAEAEVLIAEEQLKARRERARLLREETIPCVMHELGIQSLKLDTGQTLTVKRELYCSLPKEEPAREAAFKYLVDLKGGSLIRTTVTVEFGKEEWTRAAECKAHLEAQGLSPVMEQMVHPSTLKSFIRELIEAQQPIELTTFGARAVDTAKLKG